MHYNEPFSFTKEDKTAFLDPFVHSLMINHGQSSHRPSYIQSVLPCTHVRSPGQHITCIKKLTFRNGLACLHPTQLLWSEIIARYPAVTLRPHLLLGQMVCSRCSPQHNICVVLPEAQCSFQGKALCTHTPPLQALPLFVSLHPSIYPE